MDKERVSVELVAETSGFKKDTRDAEQSLTNLKVKALEVKTALSQAKSELSAIARGKGTSGLGFQEVAGDVVRLQDELEQTNSEIKEMTSNTGNVGKTGSTAFSNLGKHLDKSRKKMSKLILSLFSVRSAYSVLSRAAQSYLSADTQLSTQIKNAWFGLGSLLAPLLEWLANAFTRIVTQIAAFVKALTGVDLIARANAKALNTQAKATSGLGKAARDATSSIDELNVINSETAGGGIGGGLGDVTKFDAANIDVSWATKLGEKLKPVYEWIKDMVKNHMPTIKKVAVAIGAVIAGWKIASLIAKFKDIGTALVNTFSMASLTEAGLVGIIVGLGAWIVKTLNDKWPEIKTGFVTMWENAKETIANKGFWKGVWDGMTSTYNGAMEYMEKQTKSGKSKLAVIWDSLLDNFQMAMGTGKYKNSVWGDEPTAKKSGFATGGIITKPSRILVGEEAREAVIPLTNQKAMTQLADEIGRFASGSTSQQPIQVTSVLQVDRKTLARAVNQANYESGAKIVKGAFAQ